jgi:hypothetical protein
LVRQADLMAPRLGVQLRLPQIAHPGRGLRVPKEVLHDRPIAAGHDDVIAGRRRLEHPLPVRAPRHPRARLIRPDHRAGPYVLANRHRLGPQPLGRPPQRVHQRPLADRELPQVLTQRGQPRIADVMLLMEIGPQRFQMRAEDPRRFEARRVLADRRRAAVGTHRQVPPRFEHHRRHWGQLDHLAGPHALLRGGPQLLPTAPAVGRLAENHPVRRGPSPARPGMPERRPVFGALGRRPVPLPALAWRRGRVLRRLRRATAARQLALQFGNPRLRRRQLRAQEGVLRPQCRPFLFQRHAGSPTTTACPAALTPKVNSYV